MRFHNLSGKRFGKLVARQITKNHRGSSAWLCKCDCGNEKVVETASLTRSFGSTKSCGCLRKICKAKGTHKLPPMESIIRRVFNVYKSSAKKRNIEFSIDLELVSSLIFKNCYYCGKEPNNSQYYNHRDERIKYGGIDRVDNSLGYETSNVVPCCSECNFLKHRIPMFIAEKMMEFRNDQRNRN